MGMVRVRARVRIPVRPRVSIRDRVRDEGEGEGEGSRALRGESNDAQMHEPEERERPDGLKDGARALRRGPCVREGVPGWARQGRLCASRCRSDWQRRPSSWAGG